MASIRCGASSPSANPFEGQAINVFPGLKAEEDVNGISKPYGHWTDATHLSGARIVLRDSCGLHFIDKANCGLHGADKPFAIDHRQTFLIERIKK